MTELLVKFGNVERSIDLSELYPAPVGNTPAVPISARCPHCGAVGVFSVAATVAGNSYTFVFANPSGGHTQVELWLGVRFCPSTKCGTPVFMIAQGDRVLKSYPPIVMDFDSSNLPDLVHSSLSEAIQCYGAGCYRASALLIRRTLEEVCRDRGAAGDNLKRRIADLKDKITLPNELFQAMDHLRLLGNDAAHIEAQTYDNVGQDEVEIGIELTKEIVKATYQYGSLLSRLTGLGKV